MLVYAKRSFRASPRRLARGLRRLVAARPRPDLQETRGWLIATGQLEQAVHDAGHESASRASAATIAAADLFLASRASTGLAEFTARLVRALYRAELASEDRELDVRVPEGFAWYALYPDGYAQAAEAWSHRHGADGSGVSVIGLRSIGTTLAAVVAQALRNRGLAVTERFSLRTTGAPFSRCAELPRGFAPAPRNIIVDEGPGLSGTSMVAVARALRTAGAHADAIHFFAGHCYGPGPAADEATRSWWRGPRVWATGLGDTVVGGSTLPDLLSALAEACAGERAAGPARPLGTDGWCSLAGLTRLPRAVAPGLETPKKVVRLKSGRSVVLKFAGTALTGPALAPEARLRQRAFSGTAIPPCGGGHGWTATPWVEGVRLTVDDARGPFLTGCLGPWIAAAATEVLDVEEVRDAVGRIAAALDAWAMSRGDAARASAIERMAERLTMRAGLESQPGYGDGRLAPHEWIRTPGGAFRKADARGHDCDHTWVGRQPIVWDLAGADIEWELDRDRAEALCACVRRLTGFSCGEATRAFYKAGYCVFRAAAARHCAATGGDARMREHLIGASRWYERKLEAALASLTAEPARP
ncbi:MAG: hypothetical protein KJZ80_16885 [Hyphomicrobiaceae bacterium]|nr:hypothetical protein [Hyphomicrobiaceae bacterium]